MKTLKAFLTFPLLLILIMIALAVFVWCQPSRPPMWSVVQFGDEFGFVDFTRNVKGGFSSCEEATAERDAQRKWSEDYDAKHKFTWFGSPWKKVDCR